MNTPLYLDLLSGPYVQPTHSTPLPPLRERAAYRCDGGGGDDRGHRHLRGREEPAALHRAVERPRTLQPLLLPAHLVSLAAVQPIPYSHKMRQYYTSS